MALVYIRPDADTDDGNWVNASGNNTNLYDSVNESVASDSDYIRSGNNPVNDIVKLRLGDFSSAPAEPMTVRYRFKKVVSAGEVLSLKVRLVEGDAPGTTIAEWEHDGVSDTYTDGEQELTAPQFALISDFDDLYLEFEAISGALEVIGPGPFDGSYLLTDEDEGYAINAMYPGDPDDAAYVGAPIGGSVAVIDAGTPANDLDDVPLDSSNLTQAGTSAKMVHWHEAPYVRWSAHNLVVESQTFGTTWAPTRLTVSSNTTTAPEGTTTADTLVEDGTAATNHYINAATSPVSGAIYTFSVYAKAANRTWLRLSGLDSGGGDLGYFDLGNGVVGSTTGSVTSAIESVGNGWYRCSLTGTSNGSSEHRISIGEANNDITFSGLSQDSVYVWGAQLNRGPIATPYLATTSAVRIGIPQSYDINEDMFGILVEPAATNIILQSQFASGWTTGQLTITANIVTAPDAKTTGARLTEDGSTNGHFTYQGVTLVSSSTYTASVYAKANSRNWIAANIQDSGNHITFFDLTNGVVGTNAAGNTATITAVGDGWYRISISRTVNQTSCFMILYVCNADNSSSYAGDSTSNLYVWGAQIELGTVASSYVPTLGSTVTRASDKPGVLASTVPNSATVGSYYVDAKSLPPAVFSYPFFLDVETTGSDIRLYGDSGLGVTVDNQATIDMNKAGGYHANTREQYSFALKANDCAFSASGAANVVDTTVTMATPVSFQLGYDPNNSGRELNGYIYRFIYVPRRVIDADLPDWRYNF